MNIFDQHPVHLFNTLTRKKELFKPINAPNVGIYVCGPTVYGDPHLGHARGAITFDVVTRYLRYIGYQVRYVRNITDVDDKIIDRQVGRNAQLFARAIADLDSPERRYPYLRILVSVIEQAHPEWRQSPNKVEQMVELADKLSDGGLDRDEVEEVIEVRDRERGYHRN